MMFPCLFCKYAKHLPGEILKGIGVYLLIANILTNYQKIVCISPVIKINTLTSAQQLNNFQLLIALTKTHFYSNCYRKKIRPTLAEIRVRRSGVLCQAQFTRRKQVVLFAQAPLLTAFILHVYPCGLYEKKMLLYMLAIYAG